VQLVEVYASVTDAAGEPVTGLTERDFLVAEDGAPQEISAFAAGEFPLAVAVGVDRSFSMAGEKLTIAKRATQSFLQMLRPSDRSMVVAISNQADVVAPLSTNRSAQIRAVGELDAWSTTALHDAIIGALDRLAPEQGRQALIVFSDGMDRYSEHRAEDVLERARGSNALVYPIAFGKTRPPLLAELAVLTGGRSFLLKDPRELEQTLGTIARELRHSRSHDEEGEVAEASGASPGAEIEDSPAAARLGELGAHVLAAMALVMPGIGPIVADGPLAAGLGEAAGHLAGGITPTLTRAGLTEAEAGTWESRIERGAFLLGAHTSEASVAAVRSAMEKNGATRVALGTWEE
jgi:Ca-activated chloride channel family protein